MLRCLFLAVSAAVCSASAISDATWTVMINDMGRQRMFTQRMAKALLMIAKDVDAAAALLDLRNIISSYDSVLHALINGDAPYVPPPSMLVATGLSDTLNVWTPYKALLENNMLNITSNSSEIFEELSARNLEVLKQSNTVVGRYVVAAESSGAATAGLQVDTAGRQRMLIQKMSKEAFFIGLRHETEANIAELQDTMQLFTDSHDGLLEGDRYLGLGRASNICVLWQMRIVSDLWAKFKPVIENIVWVEAASDDALQSIADQNIPFLVDMNKAVGLMASGDTSCSHVESIDYTGWANLINGGGKQRMMGQKASRLFFQIARGVNVADSKVTLSTTLTAGFNSLRGLVEGSIAGNVPAPPTQEIADKLIELWSSWERFGEMLTNGMNMDPMPIQVIQRVAVLSRQALTSMNEAVEMYVTVALTALPSVPSVVINIAGRQRMYQAKMSKEALLAGLAANPEMNLELMATTMRHFEEVHWDLLLGRPATATRPAIARTTHVCILDQMKNVLDRFMALKALCHEIGDAGSKASPESLLELDSMNPVAFATMNAAVSLYASGGGTCELKPSSEEWDMVIAAIGRMRALVEQVTRDFLYTLQNINSTSGDIRLPASLEALHDVVWSLKYGSTADGIPTPPTKALADTVFEMSDALDPFKSMLQVDDLDEVVVDEVVAQSIILSNHALSLMGLYVDRAWEEDKTVKGIRLNASATLLQMVKRIEKQTVLLRYSDCPACLAEGAQIADSISTFEKTYTLLHDGRGQQALSSTFTSQRRLNEEGEESYGSMYDVEGLVPGSIEMHQMQQVYEKWQALRPLAEAAAKSYADSGNVPKTSQLIAVLDEGRAVAIEADEAVVKYSTMARTTTPVPLELLTPLPLTGNWLAGRTMRTAALFAEDLINQQQRVIQGFAIKNRFFDDQCDPQEGMRIVLQESVKTNYIALAGMGCSDVCQSAAFAAASMNLPFLSYQCSSKDLSDVAEYPGFVRMGTPPNATTNILKALAATYFWSHVAIVSGSLTTYGPQVDALQASLQGLGLATSTFASNDRTWDETRAMMSQVQQTKRRVVIMLGTEDYFRRVVCATISLGFNVGVAWVYEGILTKQWWTLNDPALLKLEAITEAFQGALNIANLGEPLPEDMDKPLSCFDGYTAKTFLEALDQHLKDGYPIPGDNETMVARAHHELRAHAADGVCALAQTIAFLLGEPNFVSLEDLQKPSAALYNKFVQHMKTGLNFNGVSGLVNFTGNDKPETMALRQVQEDSFLVVGLSFPNGSLQFGENGGPTNESWRAAMPDAKPYFPYFVFQILTPITVICCPSIAGWIRRV
eukprot:TRINITY_DN9570_c0_g3_i2.p1 TRINITY_DN9570_c0_g3~~TRINITY_DN9570_c0_g3_i2.p1  ORF type:complete len:1317 (+),score=311.18 TRINITY_DN9570_c0_g3_i2:284-4234(+)